MFLHLRTWAAPFSPTARPGQARLEGQVPTLQEPEQGGGCQGHRGTEAPGCGPPRSYLPQLRLGHIHPPLFLSCGQEFGHEDISQPCRHHPCTEKQENDLQTPSRLCPQHGATKSGRSQSAKAQSQAQGPSDCGASLAPAHCAPRGPQRSPPGQSAQLKSKSHRHNPLLRTLEPSRMSLHTSTHVVSPLPSPAPPSPSQARPPVSPRAGCWPSALLAALLGQL